MAIKTYLVTGKAKWCKIIGEPRPGYDETQKEWTFDLILDDKSKKEFLESGADEFYVRSSEEGEEYVRFTRRAIKADGTEAKPIRVVDHKGEDWGTDLIGNGSTLNVQFSLNEVKSKGKKKLKPSVLAVQVWDLVKYKAKSGFPTKDITPEESNTPEEPSDNW